MANLSTILYSAPISVGISLDGLAGAGVTQQSDVIDNTVDLFDDIIVQLTVTYPTGSPGSVSVWYATSQDGVTFDGAGTTGVDGLYTSGDFNNLYQLYQATVYTQPGETSSHTASLNYGPGFVSPFYSFVVTNSSSDALGTGCSLKIVGVKAQSG